MSDNVWFWEAVALFWVKNGTDYALVDIFEILYVYFTLYLLWGTNVRTCITSTQLTAHAFLLTIHYYSPPMDCRRSANLYCGQHLDHWWWSISKRHRYTYICTYLIAFIFITEVKIRFSGCAVKCPGTSNFARSSAVLSGHVRRTRPSISQFVWSLLQNCTHTNVLAM